MTMCCMYVGSVHLLRGAVVNTDSQPVLFCLHTLCLQSTCTSHLLEGCTCYLAFPSPLRCSLQKFKLNLANTVVSQENASFAAMDTSSLLDLFSLQTSSSSAAAKVQPSAAGGKVPGASGSLTAVLQELSDIWDEQDYSTEYDLKTYTDSLPSNS